MANYAEGVNPEVLRWARERAGYSIAQIAEAFGKDSSEVLGWEDGGSVPTYIQLERLAYRFYKRPLALFFFPTPPSETDPKEEFRTLPDFEIANLLPDTRHAIREGRAMQEALRDLCNGKNPSSRLVFNDLHMDASEPVPQAAGRLRSYLEVSIQHQSEWSGSPAALAGWRERVEAVGVFVFKRSFKQEDVSGFCLIDAEFPIIYLNNSTAKTRQIFTMFHELAHILVRSSGITKTDHSYVSSLSGEERSIEIFCNAFAGEFLVPSLDFEHRFDPRQPIEESTTRLAGYYNVSREVILRKLLDRGIVSQGYYEEMAQSWVQEFEESWKSGRGGNYYYTQAEYLGDRYMNLAFSQYYEGNLSLQELAGYLNIKAKSVEGLERQMLRRAFAQ
jgi:Zn-dependent peptidase ImmA (M78 family)/transcriptional regulator with XRE-family HTH domain